MSERSGLLAAENLVNNFVESFADSIPKESSSTFFERSEKSSVSESFNRLFGRQKPVHHLLGGGKSADVLLWRNKRISVGVLAVATLVWLLLEWLEYHLLTLICIGLVFCMTILFLLSNASFFLNRSAPSVPRISIPEQIFIDAAVNIRNEVNMFLSFLQNVAVGKDVKKFLVVAGSLFITGIIGSYCNFITIVYIGLVAAHILPVLYEKHEDKVDSFISNAWDQTKRNYGRVGSQVLARIPKGNKSH
ncbi:hypothetical protein SUGI_0939880 [Cryptomeria japonica]|uniref:reticulon-like protein B8 n=1 Tax=Cryptomeria japonica TaxID=3369 RepID=UPI002414BF18|nr:reticulon-like protein B8 [Cryptomeria japonica]GLJ44703.1 hypothetical protein SUGI_0939880 [Cryptomeria japonica]